MRLRINDLAAALDDDSTLEELAARRLKVARERSMRGGKNEWTSPTRVA